MTVQFHRVVNHRPFLALGWGFALVAVIAMTGCRQSAADVTAADGSSTAGSVIADSSAVISVAGASVGEATPSEPIARHETVIRQPPMPQGVPVNHQGMLITLQCQTCHGARDPQPATTSASELDDFHQGLKMAHGNLTCVSCHNPADGYASLRLADGRAVSFADSMTLCSQCHGTQFRDYQHGAHGGMTGYWDLTRGGRERNHCLHCHDAHSPHYPEFQPAPAPRDRFAPTVPGESHE